MNAARIATCLLPVAVYRELETRAVRDGETPSQLMARLIERGLTERNGVAIAAPVPHSDAGAEELAAARLEARQWRELAGRTGDDLRIVRDCLKCEEAEVGILRREALASEQLVMELRERLAEMEAAAKAPAIEIAQKGKLTGILNREQERLARAWRASGQSAAWIARQMDLPVEIVRDALASMKGRL